MTPGWQAPQPLRALAAVLVAAAVALVASELGAADEEPLRWSFERDGYLVYELCEQAGTEKHVLYAADLEGALGGALLVSLGARVALEDAVIERNRASRGGGGILVRDDGALSPTRVTLKGIAGAPWTATQRSQSRWTSSSGLPKTTSNGVARSSNPLDFPYLRAPEP